ncbi:glycosyltransferase [Phaeobacter sp. PT47_59]|uniref:glycosyltransferase n=1 Tax=Phaeobacter sp. PT47_59 TaxID=3029979 RepID=UPI002380465D|nr:glycosyltransferase [Phaeobacter sp. PT47_59]MDE4175244.1 glycosyltransferase [Phaeobacter sp. PT47_59]
MKTKSYIETLFSADWYLAQNPDAEAFPGGALAHYTLFGWREGRSPHPLFDVAWYLAQNPEVAAGDMEPCDHYMNHGWRAMRSPHPLFNPAWYLLQNPSVMAEDVDPWWHYLQTGWREGRSPHPLFDTEWYLAVNGDVAQAGLEPFGHYLQAGWRMGRSPHPLFDAAWYRVQYDVPQEVDCWQDYLQSGWQMGRSPHPRFDAEWYQSCYLDPVALPIEPLGHYLQAGWREGLLPHEGYIPMGSDTAQGNRSPLYQDVTRGTLWKRVHTALRADGRRGRILLVTHDTQLGGAQTVLRLFADWLMSSTRFSVGIVAIDGGHFRPDFERIAPVFVLSDHAEEDRAAALADWAGEDVQAVFVNSIVSGAFYKYWSAETPSAAFIHELPQILERYSEEVDLVRAHSDHVICGGPGVFAALKGEYGFDETRLTSAHSYVEALPRNDSEADRLARRRAARAALGVPQERILVMGCGVLHWRKSPDKFIETAKAVLEAGLDAEFVWLGGGPDEEDCIRQAEAAGLAERVRFTGYEPDVAGKLAGADIFLLSSQEDPFPLVALYAAQAGVPLVCFQEAGGIADFVQSGSGVAVPFMDIPAMAEAVLRYGRDEDLRARDGQAGRDQVARKHTIEAVGPLLLHHLRQVAGLKPEVSVVLPNYNYEDYLPQRLDSITAQSFQDFELILLDDASSDGSPQLLKAFAETRAGTRTALSTENSGSPFAQWLRGMEMAEAEIVWLAEADDWCEDNLLTTLLPMFDDRNLRLASCMSVPVQSDGTVIGDYPSLYLDRINPGRWDRDFVATDHEEANEGLGIANTIPNASAVLMRKFDPDPEFVEAVTGMRLCGDWFFYIRAMKGGLVGFSAAPLNYHRRHENTVTHKLEGSLRYFNELAEVRTYVGRTYRQSPQAQAQIQQFLEQDIARFNVPDPQALPQLPAPQKALPTLAVIASDLSPGGGQMFAISLANDWHRRGGRVVLINAHYLPTHPAVLSKLNPEVALYNAREEGFDLAPIVMRYGVDIIHSSMWWADALVDNYRNALPADIPWVVSTHGCYETLLQRPGIDRSFPGRMPRMIERVSAWVYTAEKNLAVYDVYGRPARLSRIPNGMPQEPIRQQLDRAALGLRPEALVMCLASRAIPSKGWMEAVELTRVLNAEGHAVDLMLIGEGPSADEIRELAPEHVHLMGQVSNLQDYLAIADVGLLPSYFVGESLPLVLIEMLAKGLPLVASTIGEIASIVGSGEDAAGVLVPLKDEGLDMEALVAALNRLLDPVERARLSRNAQKRFDAEFRIERMVDRYAELYHLLLANHVSASTGID